MPTTHDRVEADFAREKAHAISLARGLALEEAARINEATAESFEPPMNAIDQAATSVLLGTAKKIRALDPDATEALEAHNATVAKNERDAMLTAIRILLERNAGAAVNAICEDYPELRGWLLAHDKEVAAAAESATVIRIREEMNRGGAWQGRSLDELELVIENKGDSLAALEAQLKEKKT